MNCEEIRFLFNEDQILFGHRGTYITWLLMQQKLANSDGIIYDINEFRRKLFEALKEITGYTESPGKMLFVDNFGKNSPAKSGVVSLSWWTMIGLPILCSRFEENKAPYSGEKIFLENIIAEWEKTSNVEEKQGTINKGRIK